MPNGSVITYSDLNAWLDVITSLNLIDAPTQMQFGVQDEALAREAYTVDHILIWLRAHVVGAVHHLLPEFPTMEPHTFEFDDILDADAFRRRWGMLAD